MPPNQVEIRVLVSGADQAARILSGVAKEGGQVGSVITGGAAQAEKALGSMTSRVQSLAGVMGQAGVNTGNFGQAVGALNGPMGAATAGVVALGLAVKSTTDFMVKNYEQLRGLMAVSGLEADAADALADTFDLLGFNVEALRNAMFKMSAAIDAGGKDFRALGVNIRDSAGNLKTEGDLFLEVRDKISALGSASQRNAALIDIFGRAGRELAPVFALSEQEFRKWLETAGKMGPSAAESMRVTKEYTLAVNALSKEWQGLVETAGQHLLPILTKLIGAMRELASIRPGDTAEQWVDWLQRMAGNALPAGIRALALFTERAREAQKEVRAALGAITDENFGLDRPAAAPIIQKGALEELDKFRKSLEAMRAAPLDQPIVKINQAFAEFAEKWGPAAAAQMKPLVAEMIALTKAAQDVPNQLAAMKARIDDVSEALGEAQLLLDLKNVDDTLKDFSVSLGANADAVKADADALAELHELLATDESFAASGDAALKAASLIEGEYVKALDEAKGALASVQVTLGATREQVEQNRVAWELSRTTFDKLNPTLQEMASRIAAVNLQAADATAAQQFQDSLASINAQAALLGDRFDRVGATISAMESRLRSMADEAKGNVTPQMRALAAQLEEFYQFRDLRDMFQDIFSSVGSAINTLVQGVILGTAKMGDAFKRLGQSIVIEFVNRVIQQALNPLVKAAAQAVATLFAPSGSAAAALASNFPNSVVNDDSASGGTGFSIPNIPTSAFTSGSSLTGIGLGLWGAFGGSGGTLGPAFTGVGGLDTLLAGGSLSDSIGAFGAAAQSAGGLSVALAGVAAAFAVFNNVMTLVNGNWEEFSIRLGLGVAGGVVGGIWGGPFGALAGVAIGDFIGSLFGGLFGGPSAYDLKRIKAADEANQALGSVTGGYQAALKTGDIAQILAALQGGGGGAAGNSVRTELVLPAGLAAQIGLSGQQIGDQIVTQWSDVTLEQFQKVIDAMKENPALIDAIRGSGDVPYLEGGDAAAIADQIKQGAQGLLNAFVEMEKVRDRITDVADELGDVAGKILPPEIADTFEAGVDGLRDRMLAVLSSGLEPEEMQKQLESLATDLQAYAGLVSLYGQNTQTIAQLSGDFATQTQGAILGITTALDAAKKAVEDARGRFAESISPEEQLAAATQLRDAILARYKMEVDLVNQIQATIAGILQNVAGPVTATLRDLAVADLARGDADAFNDLYLSLAQMATAAPTAAQQLFAIAQGIGVVLAALPTSAGFFANGSSLYSDQTTGGTVSSAPIADQIVAQLAANVAPFFAALGDMIAAAAAAGDLQGQLSLLQQQADLIKQVGAAAIQAVQQWAATAIQATNEAADAMVADINKNWDAMVAAINAAADAEIAGVEAARDARIASLEDEISATQEAAKARQEQIATEIDGLQAQQDAIQEQIRATNEWRNVVESIGDFLTGLKLGNQAPINPADQLALAQANFAAAQAAFDANPTAAGAGDVQKAAQDLLSAGQNVFTRPSPEYQALFASVMQAMEGVQAIAGANAGPASAADLQAQTDAIAERIKALQDESQRVGDEAAKQVDLLREQIDSARTSAQETIDGINARRREALQIAEDARQADLDLVAKWKQAQIDAINETASTTIQNIQDGMAAALRENAAQQSNIQQQLLDSQLAQLHAIIGDETVQAYMAEKARDTVTELQALNEKVGDFLASIPQHADGTTYARGGLAILHPGEIVLPPGVSDTVRRGGRMPTAVSASRASGAPTINVTVNGGDDPVKTQTLVRRAIADALREYDRAR